MERFSGMINTAVDIKLFMYLRHAVYGHVKHQQGRCGRDCMVVGFVTTCAISTNNSPILCRNHYI
jgi:hypothetical protein